MQGKSSMTGTLPTAKLLRRWLDGESQASLAKDAGVSRQRIGQRIAEYGVDVMRPRSQRKLPKPKATASRTTGGRLRFRWNETNGHWWAYSRFSKRTVRAAQAIAEKRLGRPLDGKREYAVLVDGDPKNIDESNVVVMSPSEARAHWRRQKSTSS